MHSRDFLALANDLLGESTEAAWRSATSRAYYAAFHAARNYLSQCGFEVPDGDQAHAYLSRRLSNSSNIDMDAAGSNLESLRSDRNRADYDLDGLFSHFRASEDVATTASIIATLDQALAQPFRSQITEAIKVYERNILRKVTWKA